MMYNIVFNIDDYSSFVFFQVCVVSIAIDKEKSISNFKEFIFGINFCNGYNVWIFDTDKAVQFVLFISKRIRICI